VVDRRAASGDSDAVAGKDGIDLVGGEPGAALYGGKMCLQRFRRALEMPSEGILEVRVAGAGEQPLVQAGAPDRRNGRPERDELLP
jgi:hypothetical protein